MDGSSRSKPTPSGFFTAAKSHSSSLYGQPTHGCSAYATSAPGYPSWDSSSSSISRKRSYQEISMFTCKPCQQTFHSQSALSAHVKTHEKCSECEFAACPKVVKGHYQGAHGKYSGNGFKTVTVAIPGCPVQRFRVCVGNKPEDIQKWREDRRKRFPRQRSKESGTKDDEEKKESSYATLMAGYCSSDDDEDIGSSKVQDEQTKASQKCTKTLDCPSSTLASRDRVVPNADRRKNQPCRYFQRSGHCRNGDNCPYSHQVRTNQSRRRVNRNGAGTSLLQKLLENDKRRESMLTLQLLEHIVETDFLSRPSSGS